MNGEKVEDIKKHWEKHVDHLEIWRPHGWGGKCRYRKETERKLKTCGRLHNGPLQVQADGDVIPCCFLTDAEIVLGNTYKDKIVDILRGNLYSELQKRHETGNLSGLPCDKCDQRYILDYNPLLYSDRDKGLNINRTSITKFKLNVE